ncbi:MAG: MOSC N-terminal beta barrel domain-containing protein [Bacteroidota bacterium]
MNKRILSEIWIYPIKSLGGIRLTSAKVLEKGLRYDRRWMLVDENGVFMTQRNIHKMALFKLSFQGEGFKIQFKNDSIFLPFEHKIIDASVKTEIWDDQVTTQEVSGEYSEWFSQRLEMKCRLVFFPEGNPRPVDPRYKLNDEHVGLADGYPLLIIGQSSLDDLNKRLEVPVPMNRFRPNLVFKGGEPYEEDTWKGFVVGKNRFAGVKPCARCILTTINQDTAEKGREPLLTLSRYRRVDTKIFFGQNVLAIDHNEIYEGDEITFN